MYEAKIEGKTVRLRNRDYERILDRMDVSKLDEHSKRRKQCSLCARFWCHQCPFGQFPRTAKMAPCSLLAEKFFRSKGMKSLFSMDDVSIAATTPKQRERLQMLHDAFQRSFKKATK